MKKKRIPSPHVLSKLADVRTVKDCYEIASVDACDDAELAGGWYHCLEKIFSGMTEAQFRGEVVGFKHFGFQGNNKVVAVIQKNGKTAKISLAAIKWIHPSPSQLLWHQAYLESFQ